MKKRTALTRFAIFTFFLLFSGRVFAQSFPDSNTIDISLIRESAMIFAKCQVYVDSNKTASPGEIPNTQWKSFGNFKSNHFIPDSWITSPIYLKFTLENRNDTSKKVHFIPATYVRSMFTYKVLPNQQIVQLKNQSRQNGYQPIEIGGREKQVIIVKFSFTKKEHNLLRPTIISDDYLMKFQYLKYIKNITEPAMGYLLSGVLLMMIFFSGSNYMVSKKKEFLYNCLYSIFMFGLVFLNTHLERRSGVLSSLFFEYLAFMLLASGTIFYIAFTRNFLETRTNHPLLNKIFVFEEKLVGALLAWYTFIVFFTDNFQLQKIVENGMKFLVLAIGIIYIFLALSKKNKLMNYLAIGNAILIFFSIISFLLILFPPLKISILKSSMIYYEVGIVGELIFFLLGLTYKNRVELIEKIKEQESLKLEAEKQSYESRLAVMNAQQKERNRISADMHDDLGAGVTAIRLYSELAKKRIGNTVVPEIEKISSFANELLNNMNAIIWTMTSSNDSLDNMIGYIRSYSQEYFENTGINCQIQIEEDIPYISVNGELRRNIFLVVKEALSNILKHSQATDVNITLKRERNGLSLYIHDNGKGIDFDNLRKFGNGLMNMKKRMEESQILFKMENNNGTLITLHTRVDF